MVSSLFDDARQAVSVEDLARKETTLRKAGRELRGACPLCGAGEKSANPPFAVQPHKARWRCYGCEAFGDVVDLERALRGGELVDAARRLVGDGWKASPAKVREPKPASEPEGPTSSDRIAAELWAEGRPIEGTLAWRYLAARGVAEAVIALAAANLRFHPHAKWGWDPDAREWVRWPAMLAQVVTEAGPTGGVHATYLARSGEAKAPLSPAKRMWGRQRDEEGRPGGAWLIGPSAPAAADLLVGEGIESVLSAATLAMRPGGEEIPRACAALSLNRLQGGYVTDEDGCIPDPERVEPDLTRAPFTWSAGTWSRVLIAVDRDMSPVHLRCRTGRGKPCDFLFDAEARSRLCASLAGKAWLRTGVTVRVLQPRSGCDFNDELRLVLKERGA